MFCFIDTQDTSVSCDKWEWNLGSHECKDNTKRQNCENGILTPKWI